MKSIRLVMAALGFRLFLAGGVAHARADASSVREPAAPRQLAQAASPFTAGYENRYAPDRSGRMPDAYVAADPVEVPAPSSPRHERWLPFWRKYDPLSDRLQVGIRTLHLKLKETRRGKPFEDSFIGSIDKLEAVQSGSPDRFFVQYAPIPYVGVGYQTDRIEVKTLTTMPREERADDRDTDGNVRSRGSMYYLFVRYPNETPCTPFVEVGRARYRNDFQPDEDWYDGGLREFIFEDNSKANYWALGLEVKLVHHLAIDIYYRELGFDLPGEYHFRGDDRPPEPFVLPMRHAHYGMGARFRF